MQCGGHLYGSVKEGGLVNAEGLDPLFVIPSVQDNLLPPFTADGIGPKLVLDSLEVVPERPSIHAFLSGLILVSHLEVTDLIQDA